LGTVVELVETTATAMGFFWGYRGKALIRSFDSLFFGNPSALWAPPLCVRGGTNKGKQL